MKKYLWWIGVAVLALSLLGQFMTYRLNHPGVVGHAVWAYQPQTFADVVNKAQTIVQGQVLSVDAGPDIVTKMASEPGGEDRIPTQRIRIRVDSVDKGATSPGQELVIFRTGGVTQSLTANAPQQGSIVGQDNPEVIAPPSAKGKGDSNAPAPEHLRRAPDPNAPASPGIVDLEVADDPEYRAGETWLLALEAGPENTLRPVSPEGRYMVDASGSLHAVTDSIVGASVNGVSAADAHSASKGQMNIPNRAVQKRVTLPSIPGMPTTGVPTGDWLLGGAIAIAMMAIGTGLVVRRRRAQ